MEYDSTTPIYLQVVTAIKHEIVNGKIGLGEKLPSGRELAVHYTINPNTASRVYKELEAEGICFTKRGLGTYVSEDPELVARMKREMAYELIRQFMDGMEQLGLTREEVIEMVREEEHARVQKKDA